MTTRRGFIQSLAALFAAAKLPPIPEAPAAVVEEIVSEAPVVLPETTSWTVISPIQSLSVMSNMDDFNQTIEVELLFDPTVPAPRVGDRVGRKWFLDHWPRGRRLLDCAWPKDLSFLVVAEQVSAVPGLITVTLTMRSFKGGPEFEDDEAV